MSVFETCFSLVVRAEGGYSNDPRDPGNWTGGAIGKGKCRGTKFGIAANAHPDLDIASLTQEAAQAIYRAQYWDPCAADFLPAPIALFVFDAAVNAGPDKAREWLQEALGVFQDGHIGPLTQHAAYSAQWQDVCAHMLAARIVYTAALPGWSVFGRGWAARLAALPFKSIQLQSQGSP